jgi:AraC-like DNA-binding protein
MLEDGSRSADGVASALDFPSGSAFRNTCQRYLGCTPHQIRLRGGASWVIQELLVNREKRRQVADVDDDMHESAAA